MAFLAGLRQVLRTEQGKRTVLFLGLNTTFVVAFVGSGVYRTKRRMANVEQTELNVKNVMPEELREEFMEQVIRNRRARAKVREGAGDEAPASNN